MAMTTRTALFFSCVSAASLMALSGCSSGPDEAALLQEETPRAYREPARWYSGDRPVSQTLVMQARGTTGSTELISRQRMESKWSPTPGLGALEGGMGEVFQVEYAVNGASAHEVINTLAVDFLGLSIVVDEALKGSTQVTMVIDEEMTRSDLRNLLGGLAAVYGWMIEERDGVVFFRSKGTGNQGAGAMARSDATPILRAQAAFESDTPAVRIKRLSHMAATDAANAVKDLASQGATVIASGQTLLLVDTVRQTNRLSSIVDALDVSAFEGVEIHTYRLAHRLNTEAATLLTEIATKSGMTSEQSAMSFVAVPGTKDLMVIAKDATLLAHARDLISTIDRPADEVAMGVFQYRIQHYEPQELVRMARELFGERIETAPTAGSRAQAPGAAGDQKIRLVLDAEEGLLIVRSTPEEYADLLTLFRSIDRPRQQVLLNTIIAEVVLENRLEFGVDYFLNALDDDGTVLDLFGTPGLVANPSGSLTLLGASGQVVVQALRSESDVDVLSQPRLVVSDRVQASFQVGGEVPVVTGDVNSDVGDSTALRRSIEYRETGVILGIRPRINESGTVTLEIQQTINEVGSQSELGPEFTTRELTTEVTVPHGQTILLAGIIENSLRKTTRKTPILGELPIIGVAFQNIEDVEERRELLLAITPTIISSPEQVHGTLGDFLDATEAMRAALHGNEGRLQQGVLNADALNTPLGGFGEAPIEMTPRPRTDEMDTPRLELLIEPASHDEAEDPEEGAFDLRAFGGSLTLVDPD